MSCTRQSIVEREGLEHDERSEECSKGTSSTTCLVQRVYTLSSERLEDFKLY
jgi:hypothetical protein